MIKATTNSSSKNINIMNHSLLANKLNNNNNNDDDEFTNSNSFDNDDETNDDINNSSSIWRSSSSSSSSDSDSISSSEYSSSYFSSAEDDEEEVSVFHNDKNNDVTTMRMDYVFDTNNTADLHVHKTNYQFNNNNNSKTRIMKDAVALMMNSCSDCNNNNNNITSFRRRIHNNSNHHCHGTTTIIHSNGESSTWMEQSNKPKQSQPTGSKTNENVVQTAPTTTSSNATTSNNTTKLVKKENKNNYTNDNYDPMALSTSNDDDTEDHDRNHHTSNNRRRRRKRKHNEFSKNRNGATICSSSILMSRFAIFVPLRYVYNMTTQVLFGSANKTTKQNHHLHHQSKHQKQQQQHSKEEGVNLKSVHDHTKRTICSRLLLVSFHYQKRSSKLKQFQRYSSNPFPNKDTSKNMYYYKGTNKQNHTFQQRFSTFSTYLLCIAATAWVVTIIFINPTKYNRNKNKNVVQVIPSNPYQTIQERTRERINAIHARSEYYEYNPLTDPINHNNNNNNSNRRQTRKQQPYGLWSRLLYSMFGFFGSSNNDDPKNNNIFNNNNKRTRGKQRTKDSQEDLNDDMYSMTSMGVAGDPAGTSHKSSSSSSSATAATTNSVCMPGATWHKASYPTCSIIHEIDLWDVLYQSVAENDDDETDDTNLDGSTMVRKSRTTKTSFSSSSFGHIDSGLWRDVWAIHDPGMTTTTTSNDNTLFVLKMMKLEHDVNIRNYERHRRDSIVMEQLTSSPYVVNGYGYCSNSVLQEYISIPLHKVITESSITTPTTIPNHHQQQRYHHHHHRNKGRGLLRKQTNVSAITSLIQKANSTVTTTSNQTTRTSFSTTSDSVTFQSLVSRTTPQNRLRLLYGVAKGIQALHTITGGPIVHADLQSKQFLVSIVPSTTTTSSFQNETNSPILPKIIIKINDFNRCRFMLTTTSLRSPLPSSSTSLSVVPTNTTTTSSSVVTIHGMKHDSTRSNSVETAVPTDHVVRKSCPFRIPTAPGKSRSPEEYLHHTNLTEQLDMYSIANVMYEIITGKNPWQEYGSTETRNMIKKGIKPNIMSIPTTTATTHNNSSSTIPVVPNTIDYELVQLTLRAYELNPIQRITSTELVHELEVLAKRFHVSI